MGSVRIIEPRDLHVLVRTHIQRFLVVNEIRHAHHSIPTVRHTLLKRGHILREFTLSEDRVHCGQHERRVPQEPAQREEAVHRTGCTLDNIFQRDWDPIQPFILYSSKMLTDIRREIIANDVNLIGMVLHENPHQPINQMLSFDLNQRLRDLNTFGSQPGSFPCRDDCILHFSLIEFNQKCTFIEIGR